LNKINGRGEQIVTKNNQCIKVNFKIILKVWRAFPESESWPTAAAAPLRQYENIDVGLKSDSYTVSGLSPGAAYDFRLCLRRAEFVIPVSNAIFVTRGIAFQVSANVSCAAIRFTRIF